MSPDEFKTLEEKFEKIVKDKAKIIDKEKNRYKEAAIKKHKVGYKTVHSIFDESLQSKDIICAVKQFPALLCEYNEDGSKKTVSQTLEFIRKNRKKLNLSVISQILVSTRNESDKMDPKFYSTLIRWIETIQTPEEVEFVNEVISKVVPAQIEKFWRDYKIVDYTKFDEKYDNYISIINLLQLKNDKRLTGFYQKGDNYKVIADSLTEVKEAIEDKYPGFRRKLLRERVYRLSGNKEERDK